MTRLMRVIMFLVGLFPVALSAQDASGDWQGTIVIPSQKFRIIMHISRADTGGWAGWHMSIDEGGFDQRILATSVTVQQRAVRVAFDQMLAVYEGNLSADGKSIAGTWTQSARTWAASPGPVQLDLQRATRENAWTDPSPHTKLLINVEKNVQLEVLDWGGSGWPVVLLAGLGNTAHIFDQFAPKLSPTYHVYGITRRGYGASSSPVSGYAADQLGDDVLAVLDSVRIDRPVLVGHSIAGEELSSVGSRHPDRVAGLIYLDAGYPYAFYNRAQGDPIIETNHLRMKIEELQAAPQKGLGELRKVMLEVLDTDLPQFERVLREAEKKLPSNPGPPPARDPNVFRVPQAIINGQQMYTDIRTPVLAIYAFPHSVPGAMAKDSVARAAFLARDSANAGTQIAAFEHGVSTSRVVRLANADHYVFKSNEAEVLREIRMFVDSLSTSLGRRTSP